MNRLVVPAPMLVSQSMILRCRREIESTVKRLIRFFIVPIIRNRYKFAELGEGFQWGTPIAIGMGSKVGRYAYIGAGFESVGPVTIGDLTMISTYCKIVGADHLYDVLGTPTRLAFADDRKITIFESDVWIGMRVTIKEGVTIGRGAVVGSGAFVTKDVEPYAVVVGVPARVIRYRFNKDEIAVHEHNLF